MKMQRKKREEAVCPHCFKCVAMKTWSLYRFVVLWCDLVGISGMSGAQGHNVSHTWTTDLKDKGKGKMVIRCWV